MAKRQVERYIQEFQILKDINQHMKELCDFYVISDGIIYLHSLVDFIEKIAIIQCEEPLTIFNHLAILPNQLFDFTKKARKTRLTILETDDSIILGDTEDHELSIKINRMLPASETSNPNNGILISDYINKQVITNIYHKYDLLSKYDSCNYSPLSENMIEDLVGSKVIDININNFHFTLTRNLFLSLKKDTLINATLLDDQDLDNPKKVYAIFEEINSSIRIYTLGAFISL